MASIAADQASGIDRDMKKLKEAMKGITIRTAGFKKDHDNLARHVARFTVALIEAEALIAARRSSNGSNGGSRGRVRSGSRGGRGGRGGGSNGNGGTP